MSKPEFDPVTMSNALADTAGSRGRASKRLMWLGASAFWLLVFTIVVARAIYFEPGSGGIFAFINPA
ncbi:hypothetical protein [Bradyrhizobium sp. Ash2021]|uniref:hypothetical protein n=1 Tax=Bradyrhizobium sp. Ash2021 TaxID=2954771 RepID=UPI00281649B8|nr:hypothetical protein [Bradyrhizobium sp. Ash2021]WMT76199.1 hypothetical protein NL528_07440 [Bradyrhizobium sp. Ash2021]